MHVNHMNTIMMHMILSIVTIKCINIGSCLVLIRSLDPCKIEQERGLVLGTLM